MKKCPYCAEEIKDEAIKCKHCGSDMPEVQQKIVADQVKQAVAQQQAIALMDTDWAKGKLNGSYFFTIVGVFLSYAFMNYAGMNINTNLATFFLLSIVLMYCCWSVYWGMQIVHDPIKNWYSGLFVFAPNVVDLFLKQIGMFLGMYLIVIPLAGLIVGALGGGIVRSLKCVAIMNNNLVGNDVVIPENEEKQIRPIENSKLIKSDRNQTSRGDSKVGKSIIIGSVLGILVVIFFAIIANMANTSSSNPLINFMEKWLISISK